MGGTGCRPLDRLLEDSYSLPDQSKGQAPGPKQLRGTPEADRSRLRHHQPPGSRCFIRAQSF